MGASKIHAPLQYAANQLLYRRKSQIGLDGFLQEHIAQGHSSQVVAADLAIATRGVIVVDRRTVSRWMEALGA